MTTTRRRLLVDAARIVNKCSRSSVRSASDHLGPIDLMKENVLYRRAVTADIPKIHNLLQGYDWWIPRADVRCWVEHFNEGFLVAEVQRELAGCHLAYNISPEESFVGLWAVDDRFHEMTIGKRLWQLSLNYTGTRNVGLADEVDKWASRGNYFKVKTQRQIATVWGTLSNNSLDELKKVRVPVHLTRLTTEDLPELYEYDRGIIGLDRSYFLTHWLNRHPSIALVARRYGKMVGYGCICRDADTRAGYIAPMYADDRVTAIRLLLGLANEDPGTGVIVADINRDNQQAVDLFCNVEGITRCSGRMFLQFTKRNIEPDWCRVYCHSSTEMMPC